MTHYPVQELEPAAWPPLLKEIPQPPTTLNYRGILPPPDLPLIAVVGSRKYTTYGKQVVEYLIDGLRGCQVGIVSGLALGIDGLAHEAALRAGLYTLSIPGSGIADSVLYPRTNRSLATRILEAGGGLLSEYEPTFKATKWSFIQRNRLMAGLCQATLIIEATAQSGTLTTARMAVDYNRELLAVPGSIFSASTRGTHQFLKLGATMVAEPADIIELLALEPTNATPTKFAAPTATDLSDAEINLLNALAEPADVNTIIRRSGEATTTVSVTLMSLELRGYIGNENGVYRRLR